MSSFNTERCATIARSRALTPRSPPTRFGATRSSGSRIATIAVLPAHLAFLPADVAGDLSPLPDALLLTRRRYRQLHFVAEIGAGRLERRAADSHAEAAAGDQHRAPGERRTVECARYPHLAATTELADQCRGHVDHGQPARLVLVPLPDRAPELHCHGHSYNAWVAVAGAGAAGRSRLGL